LVFGRQIGQREEKLARLIEIRHPKTCPPTIEAKVGDLLAFDATGGHIRSGPDLVQFLGPFIIGTLQNDGKVITPMGNPHTVMFLCRGSGQANIDVVTGDPWRTFETITLRLTIEA
jgi:hypothetical protein